MTEMQNAMAGGAAEMFLAGALDLDGGIWVPQATEVWFRPLMLNVTEGYYVNLLRVRRAGILSRHRHLGPVHAVTLRGTWRYLEHDWIANQGDYVFEPPGEIHTLMVDASEEEMITFFNISGAMIYLDEIGKLVAFEDVHTKIEMCRKHYIDVGLGEKFVDQFVR